MQNRLDIFLLLVLTLFSCNENKKACIEILDKEFLYIDRITKFEDNIVQMNYNSFEMSYGYKKIAITYIDSLFKLGDSLVHSFKQNAESLPYAKTVDNYNNSFTNLTSIYLQNIKDKEILYYRNIFYHDSLISKIEDKCIERVMKQIMTYQIRSYNNYLKALVLKTEGYPLIIAW